MAGADFGTNIGAAIVRDSVCAAIREARYCFQFKSFVKALGDEKENLSIKRKSVQDSAKKAKEETKKSDIVVEKWLNDANILIAEADKLEEKAITSKRYCLRSCPNWSCRYCLAKQIEKKTKAMVDHNKGIELKMFDRLLTLPGMKYYSTEGFIFFNSTKVAYDQILEALKDDEVDMLGLYGMGGSGKTTLAKEVGKEAEHLFDKVFILAVSTKVEVRKIQGRIASSLTLELKEEDETERARRLWLSLTNLEERILIILDDVWEKLDFKAIGIPFGEGHKGCKVLLTTRRRQVCHLMGCKRQISLSLLLEEEAWTLFQMHAGITDDMSLASKCLAREITNECKGLPVAIAAMASTLKGKPQGDWEEALETLRESRPMDVEEGLRDPYACLKLSYDNLRSKNAEQLFLLCCLFPEDWDIHLEHLTRIGIGLGLVGEVRSYRRARNQLSAAIHKLIDSCLLLDADEEQRVKMHDLVRDVGLWIANKEIKAVIWPQMFERTFKAATVKYSLRYLWCEMVENFPNELDFPELEFLNVITDLEHVELSDDIFQGMKELRVLVLANQSFGRTKPMLHLSKPIQSLKNLRCLILFGWELGDISFLGSLETLENLTLQSCSFHELPNEIVHLANLRLLDLSECQSKRNPYKVIGRCSQLEELYFIGNEGEEWEDQGKEDTAEFFAENIVDLGALQRYHLEIGKSFGTFDYEDFTKSRALSVQYFDASTSNATITSSATIKDLMHKAEVLSLGHIRRGCKNIIPDLVQTIGGGIADLVELQLCDSDVLECLIDNANHLCQLGSVFSKLVKLRISGMDRLETLCNGPPPPGIFEKLEGIHIMDCRRLYSSLFVGKLNLYNLKVLELRNCPVLTCLLTPAIAQGLVLLEILEIKECNGLKHIITNEEWEIISDDSHLNSYTPLFPKLKHVVVERCKQLEDLIPASYAHGLEHLETLQIICGPKLKYIFGDYNHENQLPSYQNQDEFQVINFPVLKVLWLEDLPNINGICPENCYPVWPSLHESSFLDCPNLKILSINNSIVISEVRQQVHSITEELRPLVMHRDNEISTLETVKNVKTLWVRNCKVQGIFQLAGLPVDEKLDSSCLQDLYLENLAELTYISKGPTQCMRLQNLESLEVNECGNLRYIFSACIAKGLPQLKVLKIAYCDHLEQIIEDEEHQNHLNHCLESSGAYDCPKTTSSAPLEPSPHAHPKSGSFNLCSLEMLIIESCPMLVSLFTKSTAQAMTSLEDLRIENCHGLKCLIKPERAKGNEGGEVQNNRDLQNFSMFPRLKDLKVEKCDLLEYIFPISFAQGLVELRNVEICETPRLKYVFGQSSHEDLSSYEYQNKILVNFILEEFKLKYVPNFISICSKNYYAYCSSLRQLSLNYIGLPIMSVSNLIVGSEVARCDCNSTKVASHVKNLKSLTIESLNVDGVFCLQGLPIDEQPVTSGLVEMDLLQLPELRYICKSPKNVLSLESLGSLTIVECRKLKFIFSASILRILPLLGTLLIVNCEELEQIIEEDEENKNQPQVCFPQLTVFLVIRCNKLKRLFSVSTSHELPKLEQLIISEASQLEELFGCELGGAEERVEIMLPKLEHLILIELPCLANVFQGNESQNVRYRVVHNCPKLTLTRSTTLWDLLQQYQDEDNEMDDHARRNLLILIEMIKANKLSRITEMTNENSTSETSFHLQMEPHFEGSDVQVASNSELPSSQDFADAQSVNEPISSREKSRSETILMGQQALREMTSDMHYDDSQNRFKEIVQESPATEKASTETSPTNSQPGSMLSSSSVIYLSPQELSKNGQSISKSISMEQQALGKDKITNETCYSDTQNVEEHENCSACKQPSSSTTMAISLAVPTSFTTSDASLEKTSDIQISSVPENITFSSLSVSVKSSNNVLAELSKRAIFENFAASLDTSDSSMIIQPEFLGKLKDELAVYLGMPLEAICEASDLDNVERIVNSLARETADFLEKNILEDLTTRLRIFKERVPKAISNMESSLELISNYENLCVGLNAKLNEAQEKVRDLKSTLSEACAEECEIDMEIQKLIRRKNEILTKKDSLALQLDQSSQALSKYYESWEAEREKLKLSMENWLKSKEDLAHANASWRIYKESLGL